MNRILIDGFNLVYRSHYAFTKTVGGHRTNEYLTTSTGLLSGAIYGFLTTLRALRNRFSDFKFIVVWDNIPTKKKALFPEYKANRVSQGDKLPIQDIKDAIKCLNVLQVECPDEEADDVIATLVSEFKEEGDKDYIYTSDKDMLQLVRDGKVIVMSPKVGPIPEKFYDEEAVKQKWGVIPQDLSCFLAFRGDTSDNVPGVASVPSKVFISLINKYKTPEAIYQGLVNEKLTEFQRTSITAAQNQVMLNYLLVLLKLDLNCVYNNGTSNYIGLRGLLDKYEIESINPESYVELFDSNTEFLHRNSPSLKSVSLFDEE